MNVENLTNLSFEQLGEIQRRVDQAIFEKRSVQVEDAVTDVIDLLASKYSDVDLFDILNELAFRSHIYVENSVEVNHSSNVMKPVKYSQTAADKKPSAQNLELLLERIKNARNSVLKDDSSRLLWLKNGGTQKASKMFGKELAEILQETIKKIERLESLDDNDDLESQRDIGLELEKIDEWAEFKLGISLLQGTITVINPLQNRGSQTSGTPRLSQRGPVEISKEAAKDRTLNFPLSTKRSTRGYANQ